MPKFSANLMFLFQELPFLDRFKAAADAGFKGVEYQFPYDTPASDIIKALDDNTLDMVLINAPAGDWAGGERGIAALPGREDEFRKTIEEGIYYASALSCPRLHVMAGVPGENVGREVAMSVLADNLKYAVDACANAGVRVLMEALNPIDVPGYLIGHTLQARAAMALVSSDNLFMQYDLYHGGMNGEDIPEMIRSNFDVIDHLQVAGVPGRHEPDSGDINFSPVFEMLDTLGYSGWIGCEYAPENGTVNGLKWASVYGIGHPFNAVD